MSVFLQTPRLDLCSGSIDIFQIACDDGPSLAAALGVHVPQSWPPEHHDEGVLQWLRNRLAAGNDPQWLMSFIILRETNTVVGTIGLTGPPVDGTVECGYSILPEYRRRGFASEALAALIERVFANSEVKQLIAHTYPELAASIGVLRKAGFELEGLGTEERTIRFKLTRSPS